MIFTGTLSGHLKIGQNIRQSVKNIFIFLLSLFNYLINIFVLKVVASVFGYNKIFAQVIAIGTASVLNFIGNYLITFRKKNNICIYSEII